MPAFRETTPHRTLISDARDLLLRTLYERTAVREIHGGTEFILPERSPLLPSEEEGANTWRAVSPGAVWRPGFVHVGRTRRAEEILQGTALASARRALDWDGSLDSLDGDGYVILSLGAWGPLLERHLILAGATETATYYAVADFLQRFARVFWLFPGELGTVIPRGNSFEVLDAELHLQEPDYRGRVFAGLGEGGSQENLRDLRTVFEQGWTSPPGTPQRDEEVHRAGFVANQTDWDLHDVRNWTLRNRLHPFGERAILHERRPVAGDSPEHPTYKNCAPLEDDVRKYLGVESRIPVGHKLSRYFSPHLPSLDARQSGRPNASRAEALPAMYPDPRPYRVPAAASVTLGEFVAPSCQPQSLACVTIEPVGQPCPDNRRPVCRCPNEVEVDANSAGLMLTVQALRTEPACTSEVSAWQAVGGILNRFARRVTTLEAGRSNERFIPRTLRFTHTQDSSPLEGWAPCLTG